MKCTARRWKMLSDEYAATLGKQIDELEDKMSEWIKVEDRLPEDLEVTLCVNELGGMWVDQHYDGEWDTEQPTHWMPILFC